MPKNQRERNRTKRRREERLQKRLVGARMRQIEHKVKLEEKNDPYGVRAQLRERQMTVNFGRLYGDN